MGQVARNVCDEGDGFLTGKRYLIHDRDPLFTTEFLGKLAASGLKSVKLPPRSPNLNAYAERSEPRGHRNQQHSKRGRRSSTSIVGAGIACNAPCRCGHGDGDHSRGWYPDLGSIFGHYGML